MYEHLLPFCHSKVIPIYPLINSRKKLNEDLTNKPTMVIGGLDGKAFIQFTDTNNHSVYIHE